MSNMVGVGPFLTIPLIIASMGGPQCMLGWLLGAALAICDGLIWSELSAAMPGTGGTYHYFAEIFRGTRLAGILPFLFLWQFLLSGPLEIGSGNIGFAHYMAYFWRDITPFATGAVAVGAGGLAMALLYRRVTSVGRLTVVLWIGMIITVVWIIVAGLANFHPRVVFDFPRGAFTFSRGFLAGLGSAMLIAMYDLMGYYDICYVAGEVRNPARTIPRSILYSVMIVAAAYLLMNLGIIAVVPWREAMHSKFIAAEFIEQLYGTRAASVVTVLVLWTAFASVFALLFGYSRILYAAASNGHFFRAFTRLHPRGQFPTVALLVLGGLSMIASLWDLDAVISALLTSRILVQFLGQIGALHYMRRLRPDIVRPFRIFLYPVPSLIAFVGWAYIFATSGWKFQLWGVATLLTGGAAYWIWSRRRPVGDRSG
jgi:amino acid transporter